MSAIYRNVQDVNIKVDEKDILFTLTGPLGEVRVVFKYGECCTYFKAYDSTEEVFQQECHYVYSNFASDEVASYAITQDAKKLVGLEEMNLVNIMISETTQNGG